MAGRSVASACYARLETKGWQSTRTLGLQVKDAGSGSLPSASLIRTSSGELKTSQQLSHKLQDAVTARYAWLSCPLESRSTGEDI
jgi:hypothetical protein